ncbi:MAG TPA: MATE family efflux transporter [Candidatus Acidoferrales bacterium]|jgi:putative MATE family efflux protein|nr:MATE family efflux transporter [Candidatus Acidoferrales bacterium]
MQTSTETTRTGKFQFLRAAIAGTNQDFTQGSLSRGIALLAIPTILEMAMESTFGLVDAFWVAHLGADAMAAVGLTESLVVLIFAVALGLSMAATATVARRIGEKDHEGASIAAVQAIGFGILVAVALGIGGALSAPWLLGLMNATPGVVQTGSVYARIILGGNACIMLLFLINGVFRGSGDAAVAMRTLWLANLINLALDPCFIYGLAFFPKLGVTGAAVATTTGRSIGVLYQLSILFGGRARVAVARRHLRLDWPVLRRILGVARTAMIQYFIATASWMTLARINAIFGSAAIAGYSLAIRIILFAILPSWGICSAAATLVGQNLGARRPDRAERVVWLAGGYNMVFLTTVGIVFFAFARAVVSLFTDDPAMAPIAVTALRYISLGYPFYAWGMVMEQAFNGAGDSATPTWINLFCYWMLQLPLAWWLARSTGLGPRGVYLGICIAESVLAVVSVILFRRGKWKRVVI